MTLFGKEPAKEMELEDRERQLRSRELDLDFEKQELGIKDDKSKLEKNEFELKEKIKKLNELETEFQHHGPDIIRLAISKKFRRGMIGTKEHELINSRAGFS